VKKSILVILSLAALGLAFCAGSWVGWHSATAVKITSASRQALYYSCPMHPAYRSDRPGDCPSCGMRLEPAYAGSVDSSDGTISSLAEEQGLVSVDPKHRQAIGVQVGMVERKPVTHLIRTSGRVATDETRIYRITGATSGWIEQALPNSVGSLVHKDELLGSFYAREFLSAQQSFFYALDARDRFMSQKAGEAQMASTNVQIQQSRDTLLALGMTNTQIEELAKTRERTYTIEIRAPADGFILTRNISPGQRFDSGDDLYVIGNLSKVWILADVFEHEARWLHPGDAVRVVHDGESFSAVVSDVLPIFDAETRTMKVRLDLANPKFRFRPGMFVDVEFRVSFPSVLAVPADAVVDSGRRKTVFVDRGEGYFEPRSIETGWRLGGQVEVVNGLMAGEHIVIAGTFLIDSESRMKMAAAGVDLAVSERDPVCGMNVDANKAKAAGRVIQYQGSAYYFCSEMCKQQFEAAPEKYLNRKETLKASQAGKTIDPVCGMSVDQSQAKAAGRMSQYKGSTYYFCSDMCKQKFDKEPAEYIKKSSAPDNKRHSMQKM
jgi:Cu(I)/Ag(I) efflux system membrane fusion protein